MRQVFIEAMNEPFDLIQMLGKLDYYHARGKLTDSAREELVNLARSKANPSAGIDVMAKLQELESRVKALEETKNESEEDTNIEETIPDYVDGKWYYAGDKATYNGLAYECCAPEGVVCVWNPDVMPTYWRLI